MNSQNHKQKLQTNSIIGVMVLLSFCLLPEISLAATNQEITSDFKVKQKRMSKFPGNSPNANSKGLGELYLKNRQFKEALLFYKSLNAKEPDNQLIISRIASIYLVGEDYAQVGRWLNFSETNMDMDTIIANPYTAKKCQDLPQIISRDVCHFINEKCDLISNQYIKYECFRISIRIHMKRFITNRLEKQDQGFYRGEVRKGENLNFLERIYSLFTQAGYYAKLDFNKACAICNSFKPEHLRDECNFFIAISKIMDLNRNKEKTIRFFYSFCEKFKTKVWKSECYYLLADELALSRDAMGEIERINDACHYSTNLMDFNCHDHVVHSLDRDSGKKFCALSDIAYRNQCYKGWGSSLILHNLTSKNKAGLFQQCQSLSSEYQLECQTGLIAGAALILDAGKNNGDFNQAIDFCRASPEILYGECITSLGRGLYYHNKDIDFKTLTAKCKQLTKPYQPLCFQGIGSAIALRWGKNLKKEYQECKKLPVEFQYNCLFGVTYKHPYERLH